MLPHPLCGLNWLLPGKGDMQRCQEGTTDADGLRLPKYWLPAELEQYSIRDISPTNYHIFHANENSLYHSSSSLDNDLRHSLCLVHALQSRSCVMDQRIPVRASVDGREGIRVGTCSWRSL